MSTIAATPETAPVETAVFPPLTLADRSDAMASGSTQALVRVVKGAKDLILDGHSYHRYEADLIANGWTVHEDIREVALNKPTAAY
jgi:hypothetical protein